MTPSQRTAERSYYAVKRRRDLVEMLAPDHRCAHCGLTFEIDALEIDHVNGRMWCVEKVSPSVRSARYWREFREGVQMRVLCKPCSGTLGGGMRYGGRRPRQRPVRRSAA